MRSLPPRRRPLAPRPSAPSAATTDATNAGWLKANPVPQTGATTALGQLVERSRQQQRELLDAAMKSPQGNVQKLLGDFWASGLDEAAVEADGSNPIAPLLTRINAIKKAKDVPASIAALHQVGIGGLQLWPGRRSEGAIVTSATSCGVAWACRIRRSTPAPTPTPWP